METLVKKQVIIRPLLSEKAINFYRDFKVCTFLIDLKATKKEIAHSFNELFGINPKNVRTSISRKYTRTNRRLPGGKQKRTYTKKAYISIGDNTIDIFENIK